MGLDGDPRYLDQAGWGIIFASSSDPAIRIALQELIDWRQGRATRKNPLFFHVFAGEDGYKPGESKFGWFAAWHGAWPG